MADEQGTVIQAGKSAKRPRRPLAIVLGSVAAVAVLVGLFFVADAVARSVAERRVAEEIVAQLPQNIVATPVVTIGGTSVIAQYLAGSFDDITITAADAVLDGIPADLALHASGFPVDTSKPVRSVTGTAAISEEALNDLIGRSVQNTEVRIGDNELSYAASAVVFGFTVGYQITAAVQAAGENVLVSPIGAEVTAGGGSLNLDTLTQEVVGSEPLSICVASYLPEGVDVADITLVPGEASVRLEAADLLFGADTLTTMGTCPA